MEKESVLGTPLYKEILSKINKIFLKEDLIEVKYDSLELLKDLSTKTQLFASLSFSSEFKKFLLVSFEMFFDEPENLEICVDTLLMSDINELKRSEPGFIQVIERLQKIPKYAKLSIFKTKKTKKVSFLDSKNEIKFYTKSESSKSNISSYKTLDIGEYKLEENKEDWYTPKKLKNSFRKNIPEMKIQTKRESKVKKVSNLTKVYYPAESFGNLLDNVTVNIPVFDYSVKNIIPQNCNVNNLMKCKNSIPSIEDIFKDVDCLFK
ncbi:hypothetical protein TUBRATIS_004270 [Tubulinosema ratisbonensis]|uniref:Uncharacterized protein n=1 Tax=Tubulinosema ratisbonensis TaxID=291195 RepID=A0A437APF0_9MICR|nr:hypothetical protein TUBRATIS_004270 [Tubulinosema ratisbonensis]